MRWASPSRQPALTLRPYSPRPEPIGSRSSSPCLRALPEAARRSLPSSPMFRPFNPTRAPKAWSAYRAATPLHRTSWPLLLPEKVDRPVVRRRAGRLACRLLRRRIRVRWRGTACGLRRLQRRARPGHVPQRLQLEPCRRVLHIDEDVLPPRLLEVLAGLRRVAPHEVMLAKVEVGLRQPRPAVVAALAGERLYHVLRSKLAGQDGKGGAGPVAAGLSLGTLEEGLRQRLAKTLISRGKPKIGVGGRIAQLARPSKVLGRRVELLGVKP